MSAPLKQMLDELVPQIYSDTKEGLQLHPYTNMSGSNLCHILTLDLYTALRNRGIESRRELHKTASGLWHYVVAHASIEASPSETDIVTDLTPWQYIDSPAQGDFLHAERQTVQDILTEAGAPEWLVSLRGLATIAEAHTEVRTPFMHS